MPPTTQLPENLFKREQQHKDLFATYPTGKRPVRYEIQIIADCGVTRLDVTDAIKYMIELTGCQGEIGPLNVGRRTAVFTGKVNDLIDRLTRP